MDVTNGLYQSILNSEGRNDFGQVAEKKSSISKDSRSWFFKK